MLIDASTLPSDTLVENAPSLELELELHVHKPTISSLPSRKWGLEMKSRNSFMGGE